MLGLGCFGGIEPPRFPKGHGDATWEADPVGKGPGVRIHFQSDDPDFRFTGGYVVQNGVASHSRVQPDQVEFVITPDEGATFALVQLDGDWLGKTTHEPTSLVVQIPGDWSSEGPVLLTHREPW